ncbi:hypothetical protein [Desulfosoma caldarium]|nr:hypothetical protein [Desulfosoma caldarium]
MFKLRLADEKTDVIVAPTLANPGWEEWSFERRILYGETPMGIAAKKIF